MKPLSTLRDKDEKDWLLIENGPISACREDPFLPSLSSSGSWSPRPLAPMEFRSPSPTARHADPVAAHELPSGLTIPSTGTFESSLSYLNCRISSDLGEPDTVQEAVSASQSSSSKSVPLSPGEALGFSKEIAKAFSDGTLLSYFLSRLSPLPAIQDEYATTWNGHLPLDPVPDHSEEPHVQWVVPRSRRRLLRRRVFQRPQESPLPTQRAHSPHTIFPTTLTDPHEVEILFHSDHLVCFIYFSNVLMVDSKLHPFCFQHFPVPSCANTLLLGLYLYSA